ncbi:MAG: beta-glucanase [Firmicutes bacterium]|nr:beta-glucanase [Bacillota bacterium]
MRDFYDQWKRIYLHTVEGTDLVQKYVYYNDKGYSEPKNAVTVSEAIGYGMLITAFMAGHDPEARADFDALYRFYKAHPSCINPVLMAWQQVKTEDGRVIDTPGGGNDSATDGDLDIAYALLLADKQWGSDGAINYKEAALASMRATMESVVNQEEWILLLGDWALKSEEAKWRTATRTSDFMLSHFKAFAAADPGNAEKWRRLHANICRLINEQFATAQSKETGLMPDFLIKEGGKYIAPSGSILESEHDGDYYYNACRTPWRLPIDYILTGDKAIKDQLTALNRWVRKATGGDPHKLMAGYFVANGPPGARCIIP